MCPGGETWNFSGFGVSGLLAGRGPHCKFRLVRGLLGTGPRTSNPPRPPLLTGRFGIEIGSNQEIDVESMSSPCRIDAKSTPEEGKARRIQG